MDYDLNQLQALVGNPSESLSIELKGWLDPKVTQHIAKIAKASLALRNRNGGFLVMGIDGTSLSVDTVNPKPADVRLTYHTDVIQAIVSRYASEIFAIEVHFIEHEGTVYPVVCVPAGVKTVVAAKENLMDGEKYLIKQHQIYVRTLNANGTISTSEAKHNDWPSILEICMDNREADVARFLRRHFGDRYMPEFLHAVGAPQPQAKSQKLGESEESQASQADRLTSLQQSSFKRFNIVVDRENQQIPDVGYWEVAAIVDGKVPDHRCNRDFLSLIIQANPRVTGWPLWIDGQRMKHAKGHESPIHNFWECALVMPPLRDTDNSFARTIDFWRVSPVGEMYALRFLEDDLLPQRRGVKPLTVLDFAIVVWRTTEALLVPLAFAKAMGCDPDQCSMDNLLSWSHLEGRELACWSDMRRSINSGKAAQDSFSTKVKVPLSVAASAIAPYVHQVVQPLFELFGGTDIKLSVISSIVDEILRNK